MQTNVSVVGNQSTSPLPCSWKCPSEVVRDSVCCFQSLCWQHHRSKSATDWLLMQLRSTWRSIIISWSVVQQDQQTISVSAMLGNMENVGVIHIPHIEDGLVESSNSSRKEINVRRTGTRAKNYKKLKHKNETSKSTRDFSLFRVEGTNALSVKMTTQTTIKSSSELADSTNSIHSKTQIQPSATTTEASRWERENNEDTETTLEPALAYDDNYYQETLASQFRDGPLVGGVALSEPSYNFSGLQVEPAGDQMLSFYSFCLLVDNQFEWDPSCLEFSPGIYSTGT